ncbi:hypothetical protein ACFE04_008382 [Oxalis oulophora]
MSAIALGLDSVQPSRKKQALFFIGSEFCLLGFFLNQEKPLRFEPGMNKRKKVNPDPSPSSLLDSEILLPFLKARQQSQPLLRSVHELPKANSTLGSYRKLLRSPTRLSQLMPWVIPLFTKLGYEKHRERGVEQLPSQSIGTLPILP